MQLNLTKTEQYDIDASPIYNALSDKLSNDLNNLKTELNLVNNNQDNLISNNTNSYEQLVKTYESKINSLQSKLNELTEKLDKVNLQPVIQSDPKRKFEFVLEKDSNGYADNSWEQIIAEGKRIQYEYWKEAEDKYNKIWKMFPGWHGSAHSPVIKILAEEPEYLFKNTLRIPGRFQLSSSRRWSSILRMYGGGDKVLVDNIRYGVQTNAQIGVYIEGKTNTNGMIMNSFEQTIDNVILCPMNKVLPVYISQGADRLNINTVKILSHQGAQIGIKHGPALNLTNYPFPTIQDISQSNVWLTDPRFENLQLEGPHTSMRKQAAMLLSGANIIISNLNMYGWMQGPYLQGAYNALVNGITVHHGVTSDGRKWCDPDQIVTVTICKRDESNCVTGIAGGFKVWVLPKFSRVPSSGGWHNAGENLL